MRKIGSVLAVLFAAFVFVSMAMAQAEKKPEQAMDKKTVEARKPGLTKKITGSVAAIDKSKITLMTAAGPVVILADEKTTIITYEGKDFQLKDLTLKSKITATYELDAAKPLQTAKNIEIKNLALKE